MSKGYYAGPKGLIQSSEICLSRNPLIDCEDPICDPTDGISKSPTGSILVNFCTIIFNVSSEFPFFYYGLSQAGIKL